MIIIFLVFIIFVTFICNYYVKREKAINLAKDYLKQKYEFVSVYNNCRFSYIDTNQYIITFSTDNLLFEVIISSDLTTPNDIIKENYVYVADNYILNRFKFLISDYLKVNTDGKFDGFISIKNQPIYSFKISKFIKKEMDLDDLENLMDYDIYINFNNNLVEEVRNLYRTICVINNSDFTPQSVIVCTEKNGLKDFIHIDNWSEFSSYDDFYYFFNSKLN